MVCVALDDRTKSDFVSNVETIGSYTFNGVCHTG